MDDWLASNIDDEIKFALEKRTQYNAQRNAIRKQTAGIDDHVISLAYSDISNKNLNSTNYVESMDIDVIAFEDTRKSSSSTISIAQQIMKRNTFESSYYLKNQSDDDDDDNDELFLLDAYNSLINSDTSDIEDEDEEQQQQKHQLITNDGQRLHLFTNKSTFEVCDQLIKLFRDSQISKAQARRFLSFIRGILPIPNTLPNSMNQLLLTLGVKNYFTKRVICSICGIDLDAKSNKCLSCANFDKSNIIFVYDTHFANILTLIITRLFKYVQDYKEKILKNADNDNNEVHDIPFASTYRELLRKYKNNFISLLFHVDGINLCKSTKLKMWLFSSSIIELPPIIRYRRINMPLISVWIARQEPDMKLWLASSVQMLKSLKKNGITIENQFTTFNVLYYGVIGDCPALRLILNFIGHGGYYCCFYCYTKGHHVQECRKRQYSYTEMLNIRDPQSFGRNAEVAEARGLNVYGHIGKSILSDILDVPLPISVLCDYQHVSLLRHFRDVVKALSRSLLPKVRKTIDQKLRTQTFPHFFNRRMRGIEDFSFIKASELRNLLLYGFLPNFYNVLPIDQMAHISLFICGVRLLHNSREKFGGPVNVIADRLLKLYYKHHSLYYSYLENFVLHLHSHFAENYQRHGALCYVNTFAQEDLIGYIASNRNGTRYLGDLIMHYYNIDVCLNSFDSSSSISSVCDGPLDFVCDRKYYEENSILEHHVRTCSCSLPIELCIKFYRRYVNNGLMFHSLGYHKRGLSNSYLIQYLNDLSKKDFSFGEIIIFFQDKLNAYALIKQYHVKHSFSDYFKRSRYYQTLCSPIDVFFFVLTPTETYVCIRVKQIFKHCIAFLNDDDDHSMIITPLSSYEEHD
ncbi:unnamed protein product [Rotaria magnacalcarata]